MRDSNAPKPALNGYLHFLNERREILRRENPTMAFAEMIRVLGAEWTKLPQHEKQVSRMNWDPYFENGSKSLGSSCPTFQLLTLCRNQYFSVSMAYKLN